MDPRRTPLWRLLDSAAQPALFFVYAFGILAYIQFAGDGLVGTDGYYHIKMASLIAEKGPWLEFPWLEFTILRGDEFTNHHFLLHLVQSPFTLLFDDLALAGKWAAVAIAAFAFATFGWALRRHGVPYPLLWVFLLFTLSDPFLYRVSMARGQSLSLALQLIFIVQFLDRRVIGLIVTSAVYVLAYNAFAIVIPIAGIATVAFVLVERKIPFRLLFAVAAGIGAGLVLHPNFPNNVLFLWYHIVPKIFSADYTAGIGNEWKPYSTLGLLGNSTMALAALLFGLLVTRFEALLRNPRLLFWLVFAVFYFLMTMKSRRFAEYFPPMALFFCAYAIADRLRGADVSLRGLSRAVLASLAGVALVCAVAFYHVVREVRSDIASGGSADVYLGASQWLMSNTEPLEVVMQTDWDDFPRLFHHNTHNRYVVGLDPDYMRFYDEDLFLLWRDVTRGRSSHLDVLMEKTGSRFIVTDHRHDRFIGRTDRDPCFRRVYEDHDAIVFSYVCGSNDPRRTE